MKLRTATSLAFFVIAGASVQAATVLHSAASLTVNGGISATNIVSLPNLNSLPTGTTQLVITFGLTRANLADTGDSWLGLALNGNTAATTSGFVSGNAGNENDFGLLIRTRSVTDTANNSHQTFGIGGGTSSAAAAIIGAGGMAVRVEIDLANGLLGTSNQIRYFIDEGTTTFVSADRTLNGSFGFDTNQGNFVLSFGANRLGHQVHNLTVTAVPEPSSLALISLGLLAVGRRQRR